jgi:hypothetical protein
MSLQCFSECFFHEGLLLLKGKKNWTQEGSVTLKGERGTERNQKKIQFFSHYTCPSAVNSLHNCTCSTRGVPYGITPGFRGGLTGTPKDRDEVNRREVSECDG